MGKVEKQAERTIRRMSALREQFGGRCEVCGADEELRFAQREYAGPRVSIREVARIVESDAYFDQLMEDLRPSRHLICKTCASAKASLRPAKTCFR